MRFLQQQSVARQLTHWLVLLFIIGVASVTMAISVVMLTLAATLSNGLFFFRLPDAVWLQQHPAAVTATFLMVWGVTGAAVWLKSLELRGGGGSVARALGGERIDAHSYDPLQQRLHNIVEEMAIASGTALPEVYVLMREVGINAFAAGLTPADAAVAVTRGALEQLTREELQGVVAHEFSHIINHDIRLNHRLIAWLYGLMALAVLGRGLLQFAPRDERGRRSGLPPVLLAGAAVLALGSVGRLFGCLIQAAVARRRELLADASAVQFTRNPDGLRSALLKIAAHPQGGQLHEVNSDAMAHLLFFPPARQWLATHPPLQQRLLALGGEIPTALSHGRAPQARPGGTVQAALPPTVIAAIQLSPGKPLAAQLQLAQQLRQSLPDAVRAAMGEEQSAMALLLALVIGVDHCAPTQHAVIATRLGAALAQRTAAMQAAVAELQPLQAQPVLQLLLPTLRQLPKPYRLQLSSCLNVIAQSRPATATTYALRKLAQVQLHDVSHVQVQGSLVLTQVMPAVSALFTVLAQHGHIDAENASQAYERALQHLGMRSYPVYAPAPEWTKQLDAALLQLDRLQPMAKQLLLESMLLTLAYDAQLTMPEFELLRLFCACLHLPAPLQFT